MTILLDVTIPGCPTSQRSKVVRIGRYSRLAHDEKTAEWRTHARHYVDEEWAGKPAVTESVRLSIWAVGKRPASVPKWRGSGRYWRQTKPDWDNVGKASDVLVKAGVLRDDVLVGYGRVYSQVAAHDEPPHVRMMVETLDPLPVIPWPEKPKRKVAQ